MEKMDYSTDTDVSTDEDFFEWLLQHPITKLTSNRTSESEYTEEELQKGEE